MKHLHLYRKFILFFVGLFLLSCEEMAVVSRLYIDKENKKWIQFDSRTPVLFADSFGIHQTFWGNQMSCSYDWSASYFFWVKTSETQRQSCTVGMFSTFGLNLAISLSAGSPNFGDVLALSFNDIRFQYDMLHNEIFNISINYRPILSKTIFESSYSDYPRIDSYIRRHDSLTVEGVVYEDVLEFVLQDLRDHWKPFTPTRILFAKELGLVQFRLQNGAVFTRVARR